MASDLENMQRLEAELIDLYCESEDESILEQIAELQVEMMERQRWTVCE